MKLSPKLLITMFFTCAISESNASKFRRPLGKGMAEKFTPMFKKNWESPTNLRDIRSDVGRYDVIVPLIGWKKQNFAKQRSEMFAKGIYPGVEYRVLEIDSALSTPNITDSSSLITVRPTYRLIPRLERSWPIQVYLKDIPLVLTRGMYNTLTVLIAVSTSITLLTVAWIVSNLLTLSVVNSKSMEPIILPKDVILVEKVTPVLRRLFHRPLAAPEDVVFFTPPPRFLQYLSIHSVETRPAADEIGSGSGGGGANNKDFLQCRAAQSLSLSSSSSDPHDSSPDPGMCDSLQSSSSSLSQQRSSRRLRPVSSSTLLIKRVRTTSREGVAGTGIASAVHPTTQIETESEIVTRTDRVSRIEPEMKGNDDMVSSDEVCYDVRGDNAAVSLDSREWGCLPESYIVGKPLLRVLPLYRLGFLSK